MQQLNHLHALVNEWCCSQSHIIILLGVPSPSVKSVERVVVRLHWHRERAVSPQFAATKCYMFVVIGCNSKASRLAIVEILRKHSFNQACYLTSGFLCLVKLKPHFEIFRCGRDSVCKRLQRSLAGPSIAFACPTGLYQGNAVRSSSISAAQAVYFDYCCGISLEAAAYCTKYAV